MNGFFIFAALLLAQSVISVWGALRFLRLVRKSLKTPPAPYEARAAVIIPCKGRDADLEQNAARFLEQDYGPYQVIFVVAAESDPAYPFLKNLVEQRREQSKSASCGPEGTAKAAGPFQVKVVVAGYSDSTGEKVHNLLAGVRAADPEVEALAFADIDAQPQPNWLRSLAAPLSDPSVTVSTGYRWYLPDERFASRLRSAWDSSIASMLGEHSRNLAWGGSMAMRRADFTRLQIAEKHWQGTVSDDYALARAARRAGGFIRFEPKCIVASRNRGGVADFFRWANRQIIITRVYRAELWIVGLAAHSLYALTFLWGAALISVSSNSAARIAAAALMAAVLGLGAFTGKLRGAAAKEIFGASASRASCYWLLSPLVSWIMWLNFLAAGLTRRITWHGVVYDLKSDAELRIIRRDAP